MQEIVYWFNISDIRGEVDESRKEELDVDLTKPFVNFWDYIIDGRRVNFIFNITEENFDKITYKDLDDRERNLCSRLRGGICERKRGFREGEHNLTLNVFDEAGNKEILEANFTI